MARDIDESVLDAEIDKTADMARLQLSPEERASFKTALAQMLSYCSLLSDQEVTGVEATTHPSSPSQLGRRLRPDRPTPYPHPDRLLEQAPILEDRFISIPNIL